jgi:hypothetical protein
LRYIAPESRHDHAVVEAQRRHTPAHIVEAHAVPDEQKARVGPLREHARGGLEEVLVALRPADVRHQADQGAADAELGAHPGARDVAVEAPRVDAGRDGHHVLRANARGLDHLLDRGAAGDDPVGEPIDQRAPPPQGDRDVTAPNDGKAAAARGQGGQPAVDGAVGVHEANVPLAHEAAQAHEGGDAHGMRHGHGHGRHPAAEGLGEQATSGLRGDQGRPPVIE